MPAEDYGSFIDALGKSYTFALDHIQSVGLLEVGQSLGLVVPEIIAIYLYTTEARRPPGHPVHSPSIYFRLNNALRQNDEDELAEIAPVALVLEEALIKMPKFEGIVYRRAELPTDLIDQMERSRSFFDPGFLSCSRRKDLSFFTGNCAFSLMSHTGRDISSLSHFPSEEEVLFLPDTEFKVLTQLEPDEDGCYIGVMEEVENGEN